MATTEIIFEVHYPRVWHPHTATTQTTCAATCAKPLTATSTRPWPGPRRSAFDSCARRSWWLEGHRVTRRHPRCAAFVMNAECTPVRRLAWAEGLVFRRQPVDWEPPRGVGMAGQGHYVRTGVGLSDVPATLGDWSSPTSVTPTTGPGDKREGSVGSRSKRL